MPRRRAEEDMNVSQEISQSVIYKVFNPTSVMLSVYTSEEVFYLPPRCGIVLQSKPVDLDSNLVILEEIITELGGTDESSEVSWSSS